MLLRVADVIFTDGNNVADDFEALLVQFLQPKQHLMERVPTVNEQLSAEASEVMVNYDLQFRAVFAFFAKQGTSSEQGGAFSSTSGLSISQFLMFAKECKLSVLGISFNLCLEMFVTVNQEEIERFLEGEIPYTTLAERCRWTVMSFCWHT